MGSARFIGRVGGLAVALGIGVAVAHGAPVASADQPAGSNSSSSGPQKKHAGPAKPTGLTARTAATKSVSAAPAVAAPRKRTPGFNGRYADGTPAAPGVWVLAAAARRELGNAVPTRASAAPAKPVTAAEAATPDISPADGFWLNETGSRILTSAVDGDWDTGFTTRLAVMDTESNSQIGDGVTLEGAPSGGPLLSVDGSHVLVTTTDYDSSIGSTTQVAVIDTATGNQTGATVGIAGDAASSPTLLLSADGTRALITTAVYDSLTSTSATWLTVLDAATSSQTGTTMKVAGYPTGSPLLTADGDRAVVTTYVDDWAAHSTSVRVAVFDTDAGTQVGTTLSLTGQPLGSKLVGTSAVITTTAGLEATVDTTDGTFRTAITGPPFGLDLQGFFYTPIGQFIGAAYLVASLAFGIFVVAPLVAVYDAVADVLGLPSFAEWQQPQTNTT